jgi:hypothetical protein
MTMKVVSLSKKVSVEYMNYDSPLIKNPVKRMFFRPNLGIKHAMKGDMQILPI